MIKSTALAASDVLINVGGGIATSMSPSSSCALCVGRLAESDSRGGDVGGDDDAHDMPPTPMLRPAAAVQPHGASWLPGAALLDAAHGDGGQHATHMLVAVSCAFGENGAPDCCAADARAAAAATVRLTLSADQGGCSAGVELEPYDIFDAADDGEDADGSDGGGDRSAPRRAYVLDVPPPQTPPVSTQQLRLDVSGGATDGAGLLLWRTAASVPASGTAAAADKASAAAEGALVGAEPPSRLRLWLGRLALSMVVTAGCALTLR